MPHTQPPHLPLGVLLPELPSVPARRLRTHPCLSHPHPPHTSPPTPPTPQGPPSTYAWPTRRSASAAPQQGTATFARTPSWTSAAALAAGRSTPAMGSCPRTRRSPTRAIRAASRSLVRRDRPSGRWATRARRSASCLKQECPWCQVRLRIFRVQECEIVWDFAGASQGCS